MIRFKFYIECKGNEGNGFKTDLVTIIAALSAAMVATPVMAQKMTGNMT